MGGLEGPPNPPNARPRPGKAVARLDLRLLCYAGPVMWRGLVLIVLVLLASACASGGPKRPVIEQRSTQGPTAEDFWKATVTSQNGREPNFEEKRHWEDDIEERTSKYLRTHPEAASDLSVSAFRYFRQVSVGMDKEQVQILLGSPAAVSTKPDELEKAAHRFWPLIKDRATEAWAYPFGWTFFFSGGKVVDIVQYIPASSS
jgi:hypothetical protein